MRLQKWEYRIKQEDEHRTLSVLDGLGDKGWELVSVTRDTRGLAVFYFKRPKQIKHKTGKKDSLKSPNEQAAKELG